MIDDFLFSLNVTLPIFLIIFLGMLLRKKGLLTEGFVTVADRFNFKIPLPLLLFTDIATADLASRFDAWFVVFCMGMTTLAFLLIWGGTKLWLRDRFMTGAFTMSSFRGSAAVLGIAFVMNIYGDAGLAPLMIVAVVPLYNIFSVIVLSLGSGRAVSAWGILKGILTNPLILAIAAGLPFPLLGIPIPELFLDTLHSIGGIATPLALLLLGAGFQVSDIRAKLRPIVSATIIKLVLMPGIVILLAIAAGFRNEAMVAIAVMMASPTTVACYTMAKNMDNDAQLVSGVVMLSTLLSSFSLTLIIFLLRTNGMI